MKRPALAALALGWMATACSQIERILDPPIPDSPREAYVHSLEAAGLGESLVVDRWLAAGARALASPVTIDPPYEEVGLFEAERPDAVAYRIELRRGQLLHAQIETESTTQVRLFLDLFRADSSSTYEARRLASAPDTARTLEFEAGQDGAYLLRVQPELLSTVRFRVRLFRAASLAFPVDGHDSQAIRSRFGAARDGGRRSHHGVDIFAPRGTPVLASVSGRVARVGTNRLGGNIIWVRDAARGLSLYYAHLETQLVASGRSVEPGDTLGLVGNSGNARTTPSHLHFGVYQRRGGPIDPFHFIDPQPIEPPPLVLDSARLATLGRLMRTRVELQRASAEAVAPLPRFTVVRLLGGAGRDFRVRTHAGEALYVAARELEPLDTPLRRIPWETSLLLEPHPSSAALEPSQAGGSLAILGRSGEFEYAIAPDGSRGWVPPAGWTGSNDRP